MKDYKGFTLIELLATIVILSIIAIITLPMIYNIIKDAKDEGFKSDVYGILNATIDYCMIKVGDDVSYNGGTFTIIDGKLKKDEEIIPVDISNIADNSYVKIDENCNVELSLNDGKHIASKTFEQKEIIIAN